MDTTRHVAVDAGPAERVTSSHDARATTFFAEGGWNFDLGTTQLTPYIGVAHTRLRSDGTTEHGGGTALRVAGSKDELLTATAGMRASWNLDGGRADDPRLTTGLAWQNASGELKQEQRAGLVVGGSDFTVYAAPLARNMGVADVGLSLRTSDASRLLVGMQARFGSGQHDVGGQVNWAWKF